jgi:hypothetical protein
MAPFKFRHYGTFTGPISLTGDWIYDSVSLEGSWQTDFPIDTSFKLTDVAVVFYNNEFDYMGYHLYGFNTNIAVLEKNTGPLALLLANVSNTIFNGNTIANGNVITNGNVVANGNIVSNGVLNCTGSVTIAGVGEMVQAITEAKALPAKSFDIPHPSKPNTHRLRHVSLEGPEIGVYCRGKLENESIINIPEYWYDLIDPETITVNLTPFGSYQELFVEKIEWGKKIIVKNNSGSSINCYYTIYAERKDLDKLIVEYEGKSIQDYPGQDFLGIKKEV